jgi:hypothetical protein
MLVYRRVNAPKPNITHLFEYKDDMFKVLVFGIVGTPVPVLTRTGRIKQHKDQAWWFEIWLHGDFPKPFYSSWYDLDGKIRRQLINRKSAKKYADLAHGLIARAFKEQNKKLIWWIKQCGQLDENFHHLPDNIGQPNK